MKTDLDVESATTLKELNSDLVLVVRYIIYTYIYRYMFSIWFGFTEIDVDLLISWWLWRRYKCFYHFLAF